MKKNNNEVSAAYPLRIKEHRSSLYSPLLFFLILNGLSQTGNAQVFHLLGFGHFILRGKCRSKTRLHSLLRKRTRICCLKAIIVSVITHCCSQIGYVHTARRSGPKNFFFFFARVTYLMFLWPHILSWDSVVKKKKMAAVISVYVASVWGKNGIWTNQKNTNW